MFKAEWEYLLKHKLMLIVIIVIGFIPSIYAVTFLKSMWDPYGKLQDLPVAVVNQDQAVNYQGQHLNVGHQLANNLKKSNGMDFKVVSAKTAKQGLSDGKYYMVVTIPKKFSHNATTLMNKQPQKMVLHYETSAGHNFTASKMTASAATTAAQNVSDQITKTYAKTLFASIQKLGRGIRSAGTNNQKLAQGSQSAKRANQKITTGLNTLAKSTLTLNNGTKTLNQGLDQYMTGVDQASQGSQQVTTGLDQLLSSSQQLAGGVQQLSSGSQQLSQGVQKYTSGAQTINQSTQQYVAGVSSANTGAQSLQSGLAELNQQTGRMQSGTGQLVAASADLHSGLQALSGGSAELATHLATMQHALASSGSAQTTLTNQLKQLAGTLSSTGSQSNLDGVKTAASQLNTAVTVLATSQQNQQAAVAAKVAAAADAQKLTAEQKAAVVAAANEGGATASSDGVKQAASALSTALASVQAPSTGAAAEQLKAVEGTIAQMASGQGQLQSGLASLTSGADSLTTKLQTATAGMNSLNQGLVSLQAATPALTSGVAQLASGANQLASGTSQLATKGQALSAGTQQFASSGSQLTSGAASLNTGISTLSDKVPALTSGVTKLAQGSNQVTNGLQTLSDKGGQLTSGSAQLVNGTAQLSSGSDQLASGSQQLGTGLGKVQAGNQTLATKLTQAGKQAKVNPSKLTYDQLAKPTTTRHTERDDAKNNGTGMAPYMVSVSLFVGALAFNMMFDTYTPRKYPRTGIGWWLSKASVLDGFAIFESILIVSFLRLIDGLAPVHVWATYGMVLCIALAFMSIVYWLNLVFGKVGSFFSMILLVLQLGGSAGTYPIQLSNGFFQAIHPWLPMTYAVNGLRKTLMIGESAVPEMLTLFLIALAFSGLCMLFFTRRRVRIRKMDFVADAPATAVATDDADAQTASDDEDVDD